MKTLLLLRHAKSSWKDRGLDDRDRPLNKRGRRAAPQMGQLIARLGLTPQQIVCSTAARTRETTQLVTEACGFRGDVVFVEALYLAAAIDMVEAIRQSADENAAVVMVVAHNPGTEELLHRLTGEDETMPTAALAQIELPIETWAALRPSTTGRLVGVWRPRELEE